MKRLYTIIYFLSALCILSFSANSDKITKVLEYNPAPGQHINRLFPTPAYSNTPDSSLLFASNCLVENKSMLGLGAFGGYAVVGFDHSIVNIAGEYDFKAIGNAFTNSAEPGIVMVSQDLNGNGIHDDNEPWYELAGSDYNVETTIHNYRITYYRPNPDKQKSDIAWKDNQGNEGTVTHISFASQATMYPLWVEADSMTFTGTRLAGNAYQNGSYWYLPSLEWGYVDNNANSDSNDKIGFNIDWAVDANGNAIHLDYIDFIKVYTAMVQEAGWLGETSTEFAGIVDLHPAEVAATYPPVGDDYVTLDLQNTTTLATNPLSENSHWADTYTENTNLQSQIFTFSHSAGWGGTYWDGFTISNDADNADYSAGGSSEWVNHQWGVMAKGGFNGEGNNFLVANWGYYNESSATNVTETSNYVSFNNGKTYKATGVYVCNSPWPYYGCKNGDTFARKFVQGDYFKLIATGYAADGTTQTGSTEFYLADYRSVDSTQWTLNDRWQWMSLADLGEVSYIKFTMESTDTGDYGMNTAVYFCLDKLTVEDIDNEPATVVNTRDKNKTYRSGNTLYNLSAGNKVEVYRANGTLIYTTNANSSTLVLPVDGLYIVKIISENNVQIIR
ncbi:MAG: DUF4465 domain-containing protein [Paludibacter sp.]|nr:DUF4465 domain-containing protein [Paludibacter sp.]